MAIFRYERRSYKDGEYVRYNDADPGNNLSPVVRIVEDLGTVEIPCGKIDCRGNCIEYLVQTHREPENFTLPECRIRSLVSII